MGFFRKILDKLGIGEDHAAAATPTRAAPATPPPASAPPSPSAGVAPPASPSSPKPIDVVDVVTILESRADETTEKLNWRTSIVDLLKLLGLDSSLPARKELAQELDCPPELMEDSAKMNMWLHKTVLQRIAANGGNVPGELLH